MIRKTLTTAVVAIAAATLTSTARADINGTQTLTANTTFSLDTGATVTSGGDILWNGNALTPQGSATGVLVPGQGGQGAYSQLTQQLLQGFSVLYSASAINGLAVNSIVAIKTNGGNYAKLLVTAVSGGSITFQYTTYGANSAPSGPTITTLQNNYSYILPGLPNYGIAPGTLFIIKGSGLNNQPITGLQDPSKGLPLTLNGTSVSVTVNGTTTHPALYYTSPTQLGAVLPSTTPAGPGTITVTNNSQTGPAAQIQVVQSALGLDTLYGTGTGQVVATDAKGNVIGPNNSTSPGQTITLWGSGFGADTLNDDRTYPMKQNNLTIPLQIYVGGVSAAISYRGRSQYPGVDQVNITIPTSGFSLGCAVSVVGVSGNIVTNTVTLAIAQNGGICTDPTFGISGDQLSNLAGKPAVNYGFLSVTQGTTAGATPPTTSQGGAFFYQFPGSQLVSNTNIGASIGSCIITPPTAPGTTVTLPKGLDAGTMTLTEPSGKVDNLQTVPGFPGIYAAQLANSAIPTSGGVFVFNATGGKDVGAFNTSLNFPIPLVWANMNSITSVNRAQGVTVTWTGGAAGTYVQIFGSSTSGQLTVGFTCNAPVSALTFTVPPAVLLALPAGNNGTLGLTNSTLPGTFTATGLDLGFKIAGVTSSESVPYQ
jgi:uncharacterized protein (TIGR03437 family)